MVKFVLGTAILFLAACSGTMTGTIRGQGTPVKFDYQQGATSDTLTAVIGDETFRGRAVPAGRTSTFGTVVTNGYGSGDGFFGTGSVIGSTSNGRFVATLLGSKGSTLTCQLQYADSDGFTSAGGVGVCQVSDGRIIDVMW